MMGASGTGDPATGGWWSPLWLKGKAVSPELLEPLGTQRNAETVVSKWKAVAAGIVGRSRLYLPTVEQEPGD